MSVCFRGIEEVLDPVDLRASRVVLDSEDRRYAAAAPPPPLPPLLVTYQYYIIDWCFLTAAVCVTGLPRPPGEQGE